MEPKERHIQIDLGILSDALALEVDRRGLTQPRPYSQVARGVPCFFRVSSRSARLLDEGSTKNDRKQSHQLL